MTWKLGDYLLLERLNQGGMADVYLAKTFGFEGADQTMAVKCIRPEVGEDPAFVRMFIDEAKLSVLLDHGNIAQTYELGRINSSYFMAMEYVLGRDLRALIDRAAARGIEIPQQLALHILVRVCEGLDYAHRKADPTGTPLHIVHRDVSPQNVLVSYDGEVKIIDFGIAKAATHASRSQAGVLKGKYGYMSPEQVLGNSIDLRSDVFACGVLLYELLTQQRLFPGSSDFSVLEKVRHVEIYPPRVIAPSVHPDVEAVILKALEQDPERRFATASDMADALVQAMLAHFGQPSPRELSNLVQGMFEQERKEDLERLEGARRIRSMPEDVPPLAPPEQGPAPESGPTTKPSAQAHPATVIDPAPPETGATTDPDGPAPAHDTVAAPASSGQARGTVREPRGSRTRPAQRERSGARRRPEGAERGGAEKRAEATPRPTQRPMERERRDTAPSPAPASEESSTVVPGLARPTEVRSAYRRPTRRLRDLVIVAAALLVAGGLVLATWLSTRSQSAGERGGIVVMSEPPGAEVYLDGVRVGRTPFSSSVPVGERTVVVQMAGFAPARELADVDADKVIELTVRLDRDQ